jgi:hypothetical protein
MPKAISILSLACMVLGFAMGCGGDEGPSDDVAAQEAAAAAPAFRMTARKLFSEYDADEKTASAKYPGKVVLLSGVVAETGEIEGNPYVALVAGGTLDLGLVSCVFPRQAAQEVSAVPIGQSISVKGEVTGKASFAEIRLKGCTLP